MNQQADRCTVLTGYAAALYSQLAILIAVNLTIFASLLRLRAALSTEAVFPSWLVLPVCAVALLLALTTLCFAIALNLTILRRGNQ